MNMKDHILTALREQLDRWEELLASLSDELIITPQPLSIWSIKDVVAHLKVWQEISITRLDAALRDREPEFPGWVAALPLDWEEDTDNTNAWIYETYKAQPWSKVHQDWRAGYQRLIELGQGISEKDLLDAVRYLWLKGYPLASELIASYDHHQEHYEETLAWLQEPENK